MRLRSKETHFAMSPLPFSRLPDASSFNSIFLYVLNLHRDLVKIITKLKSKEDG